MPASAGEMIMHVRGLLAGVIQPDTVPVWDDGTTATDEDLAGIGVLLLHEVQTRIAPERKKARRRSGKLLRRFLTPTQRGELRRLNRFEVIAPSGRHYRFWPRTALVEEVERHGKRFYRCASFCLHDHPSIMPEPDVVLAQLLMLSEDEERFRATANRSVWRQSQWDGEWRRRLNAAQRARREAAA